MLPDTTHISFVHLRVSNLERVLEFYERSLGFQRTSEDGSTVGLGVGSGQRPFLFLSEERTAVPSVRRAPGLFHVAYLYPNRKELAKAFLRLYNNQWTFQGFADHGVSEALYLADPEGNGIELYADRPRSKWLYTNGQLQMKTDSLGLQDLLSEVSVNQKPDTNIDPSTKIGHIHLQVSDLSKAEKFYHHLVGFDVTQRNYPGALFVSAGGYHHHLGFNIWNSRGGVRPNERSLGLARFGIEIDNKNTLNDLKQLLTNEGRDLESNGKAFVAEDLDSIPVEFS